MDEMKCSEYGAVLPQDVRFCPVCGCPTEEVTNNPSEENASVAVEPAILNETNVANDESAANAANTANAVPIVPLEKAKTYKVNFAALASLVLGIVIIIMGSSVMNKNADLSVYKAKPYDADYAAFGGDFYTEIYAVTDMIVDELNDMNNGIATVSRAVVAEVNTVYYTTGMLMIAIGLGVIAIAGVHVVKRERSIT